MTTMTQMSPVKDEVLLLPQPDPGPVIQDQINPIYPSNSFFPELQPPNPTISPFFEPHRLVSVLSGQLGPLELSFVQVEGWIIVHPDRLLQILDEPIFGAIQLLVNCQDGQFLHRVWGRVKSKGHVTSEESFIRLCLETFEQIVPCAGIYDLSPDQNPLPQGPEFVAVDFPFKRRISRHCLLSYKVTHDLKPSTAELLGIGLCTKCAVMMLPNDGWNLEDDSNVFLFGKQQEEEHNNFEMKYQDQNVRFSPVKNSFSGVSPNNKKKRKVKRISTSEMSHEQQNATFAQIVEQYAVEQYDGSVVFKCPHCSHTVGASRSLTRHLRMRHFFGDFECTECTEVKYRARYLQDLISHWKQFHSESDFTCPSCQKESFKIEGENFNEPIVKHYFNCHKMAEYLSQKRRMDRKPSVYYTKKHVCKTCGKKYLHEHLLKDHMNTHQGMKPHKCQECKFATASSASLLHHRKIHMRERGMEKTEHDGLLYHFCDLCGNKYNSANYLQHHIRSHHQGIKKKKQCDLCGKVFNNPTTLRRHKGREHPSNPALTCAICGHVCADTHGFKNHAKVHKEPNLICRFCGKALKNKQSLEAHERCHTGEKPFSCDACDYKCKASSVLNKHKVAKHGFAGPVKNLAPLSAATTTTTIQQSNLITTL